MQKMFEIQGVHLVLGKVCSVGSIYLDESVGQFAFRVFLEKSLIHRFFFPSQEAARAQLDALIRAVSATA